MRAEIYPIAGVPFGRLAIMPRPRAGDWLPDEVASWRGAGHGGAAGVAALLTEALWFGLFSPARGDGVLLHAGGVELHGQLAAADQRRQIVHLRRQRVDVESLLTRQRRHHVVRENHLAV